MQYLRTQFLKENSDKNNLSEEERLEFLDSFEKEVTPFIGKKNFREIGHYFNYKSLLNNYLVGIEKGLNHHTDKEREHHINVLTKVNKSAQERLFND